MSAHAVSEVWVDKLESEHEYFPPYVCREFFTRLVSTRWISSLIKDPSAAAFLEAGCGIGRFGIAIATAGRKVTLMDCSEKSLQAARRLKELAEGYFGPLDVECLKGELERTRFKDGIFDATFNEGVLEHWSDRCERIGMLSEMARVTKAGGLVSVRVVNTRNALYNFLFLASLKKTIPFCHRYDLKGLRREMEDAGLDVVYCDGEVINDPGVWTRRGWLIGLLKAAGFVINRLPKRFREVLCPSIFCIGVVKRSQR